jgi:hypothetical protein
MMLRYSLLDGLPEHKMWAIATSLSKLHRHNSHFILVNYRQWTNNLTIRSLLSTTVLYPLENQLMSYQHGLSAHKKCVKLKPVLSYIIILHKSFTILIQTTIRICSHFPDRIFHFSHFCFRRKIFPFSHLAYLSASTSV